MTQAERTQAISKIQNTLRKRGVAGLIEDSRSGAISREAMSLVRIRSNEDGSTCIAVASEFPS